tara:strand:+ start:1633 stop:1893 length:261 start_codon:yes stop_codon:yes gene_type:complete
MIDTDKYEGHTEDEETWSKYANWATARYLRDADEQLIADAPLLLEEVKRLQKELNEAKDVIGYALDRVGNDDDAKRVFEDFLEVIE